MARSPKTTWARWAMASMVAILLISGGIWWKHRCPVDIGTLVKIDCSHQGGNLTGDYSWDMTVAANGNGTIVRNNTTRSISAPKAMQAFQKALNEIRLCDLPSEVGDRVVDASFDVITVKMTNLEKTISLGYVPPENRLDREFVESRELFLLAKKLAEPEKTGTADK